jgi:hypothetical protein
MFALGLIVPLLDPVLASACPCQGPGAAAGGVQVWSARTLDRGSFAALLRADYVGYESLSQSQIVELTDEIAGGRGHLNVSDASILTTWGVSYGVTDRLEAGLLMGYYAAFDVGEGHPYSTGFEFSDFGDINGIADTWFLAKYRAYSSSDGDVAVVAAIKAPTGQDDIVIDGERVDQSMQPATGSWDGSLALAYSRTFNDRVVASASVQYILRTNANDYQMGNQINAGVAVTARLNHMFASRGIWGLLEVSLRDQGVNEQYGDELVNSGGTTLFATPGLRASVTSELTATVALSLPFVQGLNDPQQEMDFKITASVSAAF